MPNQRKDDYMKSNQRSLSILCVDDEEIILKSLRRQLREICSHVHIELAQSSSVALALIEKRKQMGTPFALMIVDHIMPGMKGDELLRQATLTSPTTYQIMLTGHIDGETIGQIVNHARLFRFLSKPWLIEELTVAVNSALDSFQRDLDLHEQQQTNKQLAYQLRQTQKMEILGNLSSEIAHDFNNLLNVVVLSADSIKADLEEIKDLINLKNHNDLLNNSFSTLDDISFACMHAGKLTQQLLSLSRNTDNIKEAFDVGECTSNTVTLLKRLMPPDVQLSYQPYPTPLMIYGNENALQQVVMNLVINAKDAIKEAGAIEVSLYMHQQNQTQHYLAGSIQAGQYVCISVKDTGLGISDELLHKIFEPFVSSKGQGGTGLGLSIVYNTIVTGLKGAIDVTCIDYTLFKVYIPLHSICL